MVIMDADTWSLFFALVHPEIPEGERTRLVERIVSA